MLIYDSDTYNPVPGVMEGVPSSRNYEGGFASNLMVCVLHLQHNLTESRCCTCEHEFLMLAHANLCG